MNRQSSSDVFSPALVSATLATLLASGCAPPPPSSTPAHQTSSPSAASQVPPPSSSERAEHGAADARERAGGYSTAELRRVARVAVARCANGREVTTDTCLLVEAVALVKYDPADADCRATAAAGLAVAECSEFNTGCDDDQLAEFVRLRTALDEAGKPCTRADWGTDRERILEFAREAR